MMVRDECIEETMNEWPMQWFGRSAPTDTHGQRILLLIRELWILAFYAGQEEDQFAHCCQTFERVLRRSGLWVEYSQAFSRN